MSDGAADGIPEHLRRQPARPGGVLARRPPQGIDWVTPPTRILDDSRPPFYRWYPDAELNVCFNAVDRHVAAGRGDQAGDPLRLAGDGHEEHADVCRPARSGARRGRWPARARRRQGRPGRHLHADGARGRHRDARLRPHRGHPLRRLRWLRARRSSRPASTTPRRRSCSRRRAGSSRAASCPTSRSSTRRSGARRTGPSTASSSSASSSSPSSASATSTGPTSSPATPRARAASASPSRRPTRSTSSTRPARRGSRRASTATAVATPSRCAGRWPTSTTSRRARRCSPRATSAGSSATPTSSTRRCSPGATTVLYEGKPVGTPDAGAFWRVIAEYGAVCLFTAPTAFRAIKKDDSTRLQGRRARPVALPCALPRGGAARPRHLRVGLRRARQARHRQLVADRDRLADRLQPQGDRAVADQGRLAHGRRPRL